MKKFCPFCEQETNVEEINETEELEIRDEMIPVDVKYFRCQNCGEEFEIATEDYDPYAAAYRGYRARKGWPQPEEIKAFREALGLTQQQFSDLLGIGVATLNRYENGALQSESNNSFLSLCMDDPWKLLWFSKRNPDILSSDQRETLIERIEGYLNGVPQLLSDAIERYGSYPASIWSGGRELDFSKFTEVAKILCHETKQFTTKLQKLFFYVDFKHYKEYGLSITGMQYAHLPHGPVPDEYKTWLAALTDWLNILEPEKINFPDYCGEAFSYKGQLDFSLFSLDELATIRFVKEYFAGFTSGEIEEFSHNEKGYLETSPSKCISYEYAADLQI